MFHIETATFSVSLIFSFLAYFRDVYCVLWPRWFLSVLEALNLGRSEPGVKLRFYVIEGQRMCTAKKKTQGRRHRNLALFAPQSHYMSSAGRIFVCAPHVITWVNYSLPFPHFLFGFPVCFFFWLSLHNIRPGPAYRGSVHLEGSLFCLQRGSLFDCI